MANTRTQTLTVTDVLNESNPNRMWDAFRRVKLGDVFTPRKYTFAGLVAAAAHNITDAAHFAAAAVVPAYPTTGPSAKPGALPAIGNVVALRVTAGVAAAGVRTIGDSGATPSATVAVLSDDGKTLTFEGTVTAFVLIYQPRPEQDVTQNFEQ